MEQPKPKLQSFISKSQIDQKLKIHDAEQAEKYTRKDKRAMTHCQQQTLRKGL